MANPLPDVVWDRHENPRSGWSRLLTGPLVLLSLYRRDTRLFTVALAWAVLNPVVFPAPREREASFMARVVRGERAWLDDGRPLFGTDYPEVLNTLNVPAFGYALYAAWRRRPLGATLAYALSLALKLGFVATVARYGDGPERSEGTA